MAGAGVSKGSPRGFGGLQVKITFSFPAVGFTGTGGHGDKVTMLALVGGGARHLKMILSQQLTGRDYPDSSRWRCNLNWGENPLLGGCCSGGCPGRLELPHFSPGFAGKKLKTERRSAGWLGRTKCLVV
jgi:hypothetical protein